MVEISFELHYVSCWEVVVVGGDCGYVSLGIIPKILTDLCKKKFQNYVKMF